jgi:hypothetical protein
MPPTQILFGSYSFLRSARVRPRIVHLYAFLPVRGTTARTGLFRAFHLFMDSPRSLQLIRSKLNHSLCGFFEVMTKQFVEHFKVDAANYIESIKSSNGEPDPRQIKYFRNSMGTNAYEMLFGRKIM